jgi:two-component system sensor histidine kinase YesM
MKYNKVSLSHFFFGFLGLIIIGVILYISMTKMVVDDSIDNAETTIEQSADYLELYIDKLKTITNDFAKNPIIVDYFNDQSTISEQKNQEIINQLIDNTLDSDSSLLSIVIISKDAKVLSNEKSLNMSMSQDMMKEQWYLDAIYNQMPNLTSARMQSFSMDKDNWVISISQEIVDSNGKNLGVVVLDIPYTNIEEYLKRISEISNDTISYILNSHNALVYYPETRMFEYNEGINELIEIKEKGNSYTESNNTLSTIYSVNNTDWTIVSINKLTMLDDIRTQILKTILIGFGILFIGIIITDVILSNLTKSIIKKEEEIRKYELNTLYSQINPHFLYNTLDTIVWMAEFNNTTEVINTTKSLAEFFRLSLNNGDMITTIEKEVNHVRQYLIIQKKRYRDKLNYNIELDKNLNNITVPKLILQPIVENSIYHGIKELDGKGQVNIKVFQENKDIIILIKDNGIGFDVNNKTQSNKKLGGVGLKNVDDRIKLFYGNEYGLEINSEIGVGTSVTIRISKDIKL